MAILERPAVVVELRESPQAARPQAAGRPGDPRAASSRPAALAHRLELLPIWLIGLVAVLSVGFGIGTLVQFDRDWRDAAPVLVTSVHTSAAAGTDLGGVVTDALAGSTVPVSDVVCPANAVVGAAEGQLCHARSADGMVSVLASGPADAMTVEVFAAA